MHQQTTDLRIGELLIEAKILSRADLEEALRTTRTTGLPVGRILVMAGFLSEKEFQAAVQAQSLIRDAIVPLNAAVEALQLVADSDLSFEQALARGGWRRPQDIESNKLGELLLASDVIPKAQLESAIATCEVTGLPLGRLLVSIGLLSDQLLATALTAQTLVRSGRLSRSQAIAGLTAAHLRRIPIEAALHDRFYARGPRRTSIRIGELLVAGGAVSHEDVEAALAESLANRCHVGEMLIQSGCLKAPVLETALTLQEMVFNETLSAQQAGDCLARVLDASASLFEAVAFLEVRAEDTKSNVRFHELMRVAGLIGQPELDLLKIEKNVQPSSQDAFQSADQLLTRKFIDERTYYGALRCYFLVAVGWLGMQQAIIALNQFQHKQGSFDDVLAELEWTVRTFVRDKPEDAAGNLAPN